MDIFEKLSKHAMSGYLRTYLNESHKTEIFYLDRKRNRTRSREKVSVTGKHRDIIYAELNSFYRLAGNPNPFYYYSKLKFVLEHAETDRFWTEDILFRLISDRCFYFVDRRRYACIEGGIHTLMLHRQNQEVYQADQNPYITCQEFEPLTALHIDFYNEYLSNYQMLTTLREERQQFIEKSEILLEQLNIEGCKCKIAAKDTKADEGRWILPISEIFRTYLASVIEQTGSRKYKEKFQEIFVAKKPDCERAFQKGIHKISGIITLPDGQLHCLAPLILYFIFTAQTNAVLCGNVKRLWRNISPCRELTCVTNMTELTGRKAGVNLALFCELCSSFRGSSDSFNTLFDHIGISPDSLSDREDINRKQNQILDFLFYLTTGYGLLFHCNPRYCQTKVPLSKICRDSNPVDNSEEQPIFVYHPDYQHPVDDLGHQIRTNIDACFANRVEFLTPGTYRQPSRLEFAQLADFVLQDMALPAAKRISRLIQKTITENPQILDQYRPFMYEFYESSAITEWLQNIIDTYFPELERLMVRYQDLTTQYGTYDHRHILRNIVEYEIRHFLYNEGRAALQNVAKTVMLKSKTLFVTPIFG